MIILLALLSGCAANQPNPAPEAATNSATESSTQISIFPDEQVYVEATVKDNKIVSIRNVHTLSNPGSTLTFKFSKMDGGKGMMLSVKNPLDNAIKYHIDMVDFKGGLHHTSSCPNMAGLSVFESWPHPIPEIRITNFHFAASNEGSVCIY